MFLSRDAVTLTIALLTFFSGMGLFIWKTSAVVSRMQADFKAAITANRYDITEIQNNLKQAIAEARYESSQNDLKHQNLQQVLELGMNGYRERVEHLATRFKTDMTGLDKRQTDVEQFLAGKLQFVRR